MKLITNVNNEISHEFVPKLFITLTYKSKRWTWDDIDIDIRKYVLWLTRMLSMHSRIVVGYELGSNSHIHLVLFSPDLVVDEHAVDMASLSRAWKWGRVKDVQPYDQSKNLAGIIYTMGHEVLPFAGEVFCHRKGDCRKGVCPYPKRLETLA
jgi:hypothetical protein